MNIHVKGTISRVNTVIQKHFVTSVVLLKITHVEDVDEFKELDLGDSDPKIEAIKQSSINLDCDHHGVFHGATIVTISHFAEMIATAINVDMILDRDLATHLSLVREGDKFKANISVNVNTYADGTIEPNNKIQWLRMI